jgi:hypothetical protein
MGCCGRAQGDASRGANARAKLTLGNDLGLKLQKTIERAMRLTITLALVSAAITLAQPAAADTLRCGSVLIRPGDDALYVLDKCVGPAATTAMTRRGWMDGINGYIFPFGFAQLQRWRIARDPGQFPAVLTIGADGRVETIEFERHRN